MKSTLTSALVAALVVIAAPAHASTELVTNGTFEAYTGGAFSGHAKINAGSNALTGWTVGNTSVDVINGAYGAVSGNSIDMLGSPGPGFLSQSIATIAGQRYTLSFDLSQNLGSDNTASGKALFVDVGGTQTQFTASFTNASALSHESFTFLATNSSTLLKFSSAVSGNSGAVLDNVSVMAAVPEPETYAMLLAGLGLMAGVARRKQK